MMEADGGASIPDMRIRDGKRQSIFRSYVFPHMDRPNLTVLCHALVTRLTFEGKRATGVEISWDGSTHRVLAGREVILSLGAIHTPKILMQSGIGDEVELRHFGVPVIQIWSVAGQATRCHPQNGREKFKTLPNLRVGLPQFSRGRLVREQFFEGFSRPSCLRRTSLARTFLIAQRSDD